MAHLRASEWDVRPTSIAWARLLVRRHHYARGASNTAVYTHGLFRVGSNVPTGVAWWLPPTKDCAIANFPGGDWRRVLSLSRLAIHPDVPTNGASFLIGRSIQLIRNAAAWDCLLTYADTWQNHTGAIYKATNWEYTGDTKPMPVWIDPRTERLVARKAGPVTRSRAEMEALGYVLLGHYPRRRFRIVLAPTKRQMLPALDLFAVCSRCERDISGPEQ